MKIKIPKFIFFLPSLFYYALIFFLSSKSYHVNVDVLYFDKIIHFFEFGILGFLLSLGFFVFNTSLRNKFVLVFFTASILAVLDEVHQLFVPLRIMEVLDLAADLVGIIVGFFVFVCFYKRNKWIRY